MKKFILVALVVGFAGCDSVKNSQKSANYSKDAEEFCQSIANFSENTMEARQNGAAMGEILDKLNAPADGVVEETRDLMKSLVRDAYATSLQSSQSNKNIVIGEFKNQAHLECLKSFN